MPKSGKADGATPAPISTAHMQIHWRAVIALMKTVPLSTNQN